MEPRVLSAGTVLSGRYQVTEAIGHSDLSAVYSALDQRGQATVALKVFDETTRSRPGALSEYQAQARQASGLGVEGIARAYDFGIDANTGLPFSTAERIGWASLDRRVLAQGPVSLPELCRALSVLARALDAAHAAGVVHRDLKPQNVFISPDNPEWVRITDFGIGAVRRGAPEAMGWGGPPGYTAAEVVDTAAVATPAADLFALGVVCFFALTRGTPFRSLRGPSFDANLHWAELNQRLSPLSERAQELGVSLDASLDPWFERALAVAPGERFRSAGEMARELALLAEQVGTRSRGVRPMPGIAAAIAQPLLFQPEPSPASLGLPAPPAPESRAKAAASLASEASQPAPVFDAAIPASEEPAPARKKFGLLPLLMAGGALLLGGVAYAGYLLLQGGHDHGERAPLPSAAASALTAPVLTATGSSAWVAPARARFSCQPQACEWVVCDGKNVSGIADEVEFLPGNHDCSASRNGFGSKATSFTATPGEVVSVTFDLPPLPAATQAKAAAGSAANTARRPPAATSKPSATVDAAAGAQKAKPSASKKKKCSTFLGCK